MGGLPVDNGSGIDNDPDGDGLSVSMVDGAAGNIGSPNAGSTGGLFTITSTGAMTFDDNGDFEDLAVGEPRLTTITYEISDGEGGTDTATVTVTVTGTNDIPTVVLGSEITDQSDVDAGSFGPLDITATFDDPDSSDTLTFTATNLPAGLSISAAGVITGTISSSESQGGNTANPGEFLVTVTADDGHGGTVDDTFLFTVTNPAPDAIDDALSTNEDTVLIGANVMNNNGSGADVDPDGDAPLTITQVSGVPTNVGVATAGSNGGEFTIDPNGDLFFDPNGEFENLAVGETATSTITYELSDGEGGFDTATVTVTINGVNDAPVPIDPLNPGTTPADPNAYIPPQSGVDNTLVTPLDVTQYANDPDGSDTLTFTIAPAELPPGLTFDGAQITGTPGITASTGGDDPIGNPGVYLIPMTVSDGNGGVFITTITYTISNPPPVAVDDAYSTDEDTSIFVAAPTGVITSNDTDPDGDALSIAQVNGVAIDVGTQITLASGALLTLNSDGSFDYDPNGQFESLDIGDTTTDTFDYTLTDADGATDDATVTITINGVNDAPEVIDPTTPGVPPGDPDNVLVDQSGVDGAVLAGLDVTPVFSDPEGDTLTYTLAPGAPAWLAIDNATGIITGTPPADASVSGPTSNGVYVLTVIATDDNAATASTTVDYTIANPPPVAVDDTANVDEDTTQSGNVITDPTTGDADTPPDSDPLTVTLADQAGNPITLGTPFTVAGGGELTLNPDGSWDFDPGVAYNGLDDGESVVEVITYTVDDGNGGTDQATLTITIDGSNDAPVIIDPTNPGPDPENPIPADPTTIIPAQQVDDGTDFTTTPLIDVSVYAADPDGDPLTFATTDPLPAGLTLNPDGTVTGTIDPDASQGGDDPVGNPGVYTIVVNVSDGTTNSPVTLTIDVNNPPPIAVDDAVSGSEDGTSTGNVFVDNGSGNDADTTPDTDPITVTGVGINAGAIPPTGNPATVNVPIISPTGGAFTIDANGNYTFDPGTDFQDLDIGETRDTTITYQISDGNGGFDTALVTMSVIGANDAPVVTDPGNPSGDPNVPSVPADPNNIIPDQNGKDSTPLTPLVISTYFADVDGEALTFSIDPTSSSTPPWLIINPTTGEISGTPPANASQGGPGANGVYPIVIRAMDPDGKFATTTLDFTITNPPPVVVTPLPDITDTVGFTVVHLTDTNFNDPDGDTLVFSVTGLPTGLGIDPVTGNITGTIAPTAYGDAPMGDGLYSVIVTVDDGEGGTVSSPFTYRILPMSFVDPGSPKSPLDLFDAGNGDDGTGDPQTNMIVTNVVDQIAPLGPHYGLFGTEHPITTAVNQIDPLGAISRIGDGTLPISEFYDWVEETRTLLDRANQMDAGPMGADYAYQGGDAAGSIGGIDIYARTLVVGQVVVIEVFGDNFQPDDWRISTKDHGTTPGWLQNIDGRTVLVLRPADIENFSLMLSGAAGDMELYIDLVSGKIVWLAASENQTSIPLFNQQIQSIQKAGIMQVQALLNSG